VVMWLIGGYQRSPKRRFAMWVSCCSAGSFCLPLCPAILTHSFRRSPPWFCCRDCRVIWRARRIIATASDLAGNPGKRFFFAAKDFRLR